jgi:hypothetical protein
MRYAAPCGSANQHQLVGEVFRRSSAAVATSREGHHLPRSGREGRLLWQQAAANRIGASRLQQISHILQVPVAFFFEGAPNALAPHDSSGSALSMAQIDDFISDSDGLRLIGAFTRIDDAALRRKIVMLVQEIAGDDD